MSKSHIPAITIPGYRITEVIHVSSRTTVYRGEQEKTQTPVVIKTLNAQYPQLRELISLKNQFAIAQKIDNPNIIKCYGLEPYGNSYALILEDIGGISLNQYANSQPLSLELFLTIAIPITKALEFLYQQNIIHKDIKPKNIIINPENKQIKLIDFSISCLLPKENAEIKSPNVLEGTFAYMSPEQTGRMNRAIDYRTDFYSLGVTFYQLLTAKLPFDSKNPLELLHCHLAKEPNSPKEINPHIPDIVADIITKLMAKMPEDRYQTAKGIRHDLEICQQMLLKHGEISNFKLAAGDTSERFLISEKIYGKDNEITNLLNAFERVSHGNKELMLVAGFSGIGKTAVINEVHKPIIHKQGYFISGKYDQFQHNIPFSALLQSLDSLLNQLLTESTDNLQKWKDKILLALGEQGKVIIDVIPKLENIIGKQPNVPELIGTASQNRFNLLFSKFIQVFAAKEHPLVIFLDDLQWADAASLKLIQLLMNETDVQYLLLIGAYRDNEVNPGHPLGLTLDDIRQTQAIVNQITLKPLDESHINLLITDTLGCSKEEATPLTELLLTKTQGNPFFSNQLLKSLYEDGLISFNYHLGYWQCDINEAKALHQYDDVLQFLAIQLQKLSNHAQDILKIAACIGNQFDLHTLSIVCEKSHTETAADLWPALQEGLILPQNQVYKFFTDNIAVSTADLEINNSEEIIVKYKFLHDRVQQAAYYLIPETDKQATHLKIGNLILQNTNAVELEENIFTIVNQLNLGIDLITTESEKYELARLNIIAARKAKSATAYDAAVRYLNVGLGLLAKDSWQHEYQLTLNLYVEAVEAEYLNVNFEQSSTYVEIVKQNATNILDKVQVYEAQIQMYMAQVQMQLAIDTGLNILDILGVSLEQAPPQIVNIEDLINLPIMTAPDKLAVMRILMSVSAAAYFVNPELLLPIIFTMIHLSVEYGNSSTSAYGYVVYGFLLCGAFSEIDTGYRYGELALNLSDKFNASNIRFRVILFWYANIRCWKQHFRESILPLQENVSYGLEIGEIEYVGYCSANHVFKLVFAGQNLIDICQSIDQHLALMINLKQQWSISNQKIWKQMIFNLMEITDDQYELNGDFVNEELYLSFVETKNYNCLFAFYLAKTILFYLFRENKQAVNSAILGKQYTAAVNGQILVCEHNFYYSLALLAAYPHQTINEQEQYLQQVLENQNQMQIWNNYSPCNFKHKYDLVEAEKARVLGKNWEAVELYEQAVRGAKETGYIQEEALANELAAQFFINLDKEKIAQVYLIDAYYCYVNWGAKAKVEDLEKSYPQLLDPILKQKEIILHQSEAPAFVSKIISEPNNTGASAILDLETVTKASLVISSEIQIDKLLYTLLQVIVENVGAKKAALILQQGGNLILVAQSSDDQQIGLQSIPINNSQNIPLSIVNYVYNTRESLLINNASVEEDFIADPYIIKSQPKSILCSPIISHGKIAGIIYLENNLITGAFTPERLKILQLLSSQAAISLENAQLYSKLEENVAYRTQELNEKNLFLEKTLHELKLTQSQLIQTEKMSSLGQMVAGIAHEINNPVNFIYANIEHASNYIQALINLLNLYQQEYPTPPSIVQENKVAIDFDFIIQDLPKVLDSMKVGAERIRKIVLGLRNFSRLDESQMKPVDIHEGIESTLMLLQPRFKDKLGYSQNIVIKDYAELPLVTCYPSQLNQVFMNILSNAIDALHKYEQNLSPETRKINSSQIIIHTQVINQDWVRIAIKDNAMGMSLEVKQRIFDPFFTTKPVGEGTGLGLSISYQIVVDKHGGKIECISEPEKGTEFLIEIPINLSQKAKTS
ncbi:trifunctional serine/threonine-protein kinase/ATP-binding protein/sensor histidine kinase [Anabaena lutea]|uniref:histidine kinase n=1 Tax=Anabaena lutea FACHB-196 TaxID=2692881 RepID=A0ABR8FN08_9NOST|nr:ATP-binding sensor histidine kinase [Anabaena lutea]MBD2570487.1 AAA family ATPase [Anabaena lutea FACHB-196]